MLLHTALAATQHGSFKKITIPYSSFAANYELRHILLVCRNIAVTTSYGDNIKKDGHNIIDLLLEIYCA